MENRTVTAFNDRLLHRTAVLPITRRLDPGAELSGRGVTIAFLDSGFFPHPDLLEPTSRVLAYVDVSGEDEPYETVTAPSWAWHGTQTSVVGAGNGRMSGGLYRSLAHEADVVLVKVGAGGRIHEDAIVRGLEWIVENRERFGIRVANLSLGGDDDVSHRASLVDRAAEMAVAAGIVLVVAAGNAGCGPNHVPIPPANSPSVLTVGGYDDGNRVGGSIDPYCSSFGPTIDGLLKPEIVAPAIWIAAPVLPTTPEHARARALFLISSTPDALLGDLPPAVWREAGLAPYPFLDGGTLREEVDRSIVEYRLVAPHYQSVDGTSFAAPIVASVVALMLEASPRLTPAAVKNVLVSTATRLPRFDADRQGYGAIQVARAIDLARGERHTLAPESARPPHCDGGLLVFHFHDDAARDVALAGEFNDWSTTRHAFTKTVDGLWRASIPAPPPGRYRYKLVVDGARWLADPNNLTTLSDPYGGHDSVLTVA